MENLIEKPVEQVPVIQSLSGIFYLRYEKRFFIKNTFTDMYLMKLFTLGALTRCNRSNAKCDTYMFLYKINEIFLIL